MLEKFFELVADRLNKSGEETKTTLATHLKQFGITKRTIECYLLWSQDGQLTQVEIAGQLQIDQATVSRELAKLCKLWPNLFDMKPLPGLSTMVSITPQNEKYLQAKQKF